MDEMDFPSNKRDSLDGKKRQNKKSSSDSNSGNEEGNSPNGSSEKRRRMRVLPTVSQACNNCREKHLKCDGVFPRCTRCNTKNLNNCAYYSRSRGKKGDMGSPQESKPSIFNGDMHHLPHLHSSHHNGMDLPSPYLPLGTPTLPAISSVQNHGFSRRLPPPSSSIASVLSPTLGGPSGSDPLSVFANIIGGTKPVETFQDNLSIKDYLNYYNTYLFPICEVSPPGDDLDAIYGADHPENIIARLSPVTFIILGYGALSCGRRDHSNDLISVAFNEMKETYNQTTHMNASCHNLLSRYYIAIGDFDRASNHNSIAIQMYKNLLIDKANTHLGSSYLNSVLESAEFTVDRNEQLDIYNNVLNIAQKSSMQKSLSYLFAIVQKVWTEVTGSPTGKDANFYLKILKDAENSIPESLNPMLRRELQTLLIACSGGVLHINGIHDLAKKCAEDVLNSVKCMQYASPVAVQCLAMAIQVHFYESCFDLVHQGALLLKQIGKVFPIAEIIFSDLVSPLTTSINPDPLPSSIRRRPELHPIRTNGVPMPIQSTGPVSPTLISSLPVIGFSSMNSSSSSMSSSLMLPSISAGLSSLIALSNSSTNNNADNSQSLSNSGSSEGAPSVASLSDNPSSLSTNEESNDNKMNGNNDVNADSEASMTTTSPVLHDKAPLGDINPNPVTVIKSEIPVYAGNGSSESNFY